MSFHSLISFFPYMDNDEDSVIDPVSTEINSSTFIDEFNSYEANLIIAFLETLDSEYTGIMIQQPSILQRTYKVYLFVKYTSNTLYALFIQWAKKDAISYQSSYHCHCVKCYIETKVPYQLCCETFCENCDEY
jgi:hypothetical protein